MGRKNAGRSRPDRTGNDAGVSAGIESRPPFFRLMLALRKLEFGLDFPTSKLKQAHGEAAVGVLDFLTDRAVEKTFSWRHPEYSGEAEEDNVVVLLGSH